MARPYYVYGGNLLDREKYTSVVNTTYGTKRYFSSIDTEVYFGEKLIDDMVAFDFTIQENKMPLFGYNNFTAKRMITGQKIIQGTFAINFTRTFELVYYFMDGTIQDSLYSSDYEKAQFYCADDNRAIFDKIFDITLSYGEGWGEGSYNSCTQTLMGCQITSYKQAFDTSGEPILDMYTFIAKDLIVQSASVGTGESFDLINTSDDDYNKNDIAPSPFAIGTLNTASESSVRNECEESSDTFGVLLNPVFKVENGKYIIGFKNQYLNEQQGEVTELTLVIDTGITVDNKKIKAKFAHTFNGNAEYIMRGTEINDAGKGLKELFDMGHTGVKASVVIMINCKGTNDGSTYKFEEDTIISLA